MTTTYYEVLSEQTDKPTPAQQKKQGTRAYGYKTIAMAKRFCPPGYYVRMRHTDGRDDWAGSAVM
jgi:hypothetical protein